MSIQNLQFRRKTLAFPAFAQNNLTDIATSIIFENLRPLTFYECAVGYTLCFACIIWENFIYHINIFMKLSTVTTAYYIILHLTKMMLNLA